MSVESFTDLRFDRDILDIGEPDYTKDRVNS